VPIYRTVAPVHTSWNNKSQEITVDDSINIISRRVGVPGTYIFSTIGRGHFFTRDVPNLTQISTSQNATQPFDAVTRKRGLMNYA